jgi:hypothetical protein
MAAYLIVYEPANDDQSQGDAALNSAIEELGEFCRPLESLWILLYEEHSVGEIRDKLWKHIGEKGKLCVTACTFSPWHGGLKKSDSEWLKRNLP